MPRLRVLLRAAPLTLAILAATILFPTSAGAIDPDNVIVSLTSIASGLDSPVAMAAVDDGTGRLFIVEQPGRIRIRQRSGLRSTPYLSITSRVNDSGGEQGMLGLAFHPSFKTNGYFFVSYTDANGALRVSRFHASPSSNTASAGSERVIITIPHPTYTNHNGGALAFYQGYLYISTGDGGSGGGPGGYAQSKSSLLGKVLRINVNSSCGGRNYCSPSTNPFTGDDPGRDEIWHWGLRNPWRMSFDKNYGQLWVADVGQNAREEINRAAEGAKGRNYGWDCYEGTLNTVSSYGGSYCSGRTFYKPVWQYSHSSGRCAVIGGYVYRGREYSSILGGLYLYADYCTGEIFALRQANGVWDYAMVRNHSGNVTSFGQSVGGELFVLDAQGRMYKVTARAR